MASPDHAATVREAHREAIGLQARFGGYAPLDPSAHDAIVQKRDAATGRLYMALDALLADLERVTRERDEARAGDYGMARAPYGEVEVMRERERAERAERQRDQAIEALRTIHTSPICFIDCTERVGAVLATLDPDAAT